MVLTETWLKTQMKISAGYSAMNSTEVTLKPKYQIGNLERGGGLAIVHKSNIGVKCIKEGQLNTFQFAIWKVRFNNDNITLIASYHQPYTISDPFTNTTFIDEYTEWLTDQIGSYDNLYITGDPSAP